MKNRTQSKITKSTFSRNSSSKIEPLSAVMEDELKKAFNVKTFLTKYKKNMFPQTLSQHLTQLLIEKETTIPDVIQRSFANKTYVYQIFDGRKKPSRDKLISIAFGLQLSIDETQKLLKISGNRTLHVKDGRDVIIFYSIHNNKGVGRTNSLLIEYGFEPLDGPVR